LLLSKRRAQRHRRVPVTPERKPDETRGRSENVPSGPVKVHVESLPPAPPPSEEQKAEQKTEKRLKYLLAAIQILAFLGLVVYVCETRRTNNLTGQALSDARKHFNQSQRPWVGLYDPMILSAITENPRRMIVITARVKNFGNSPASNMIPAVDFMLGKRGTDIRPEIDKVCAGLERGFLPLKIGEILFPGDTFSFPTQIYPVADEAQADPIYFFPGCIIYIDAENQVRHTRICQWTDREHLKAGASLSSCSRQSAD
jgi:hypothetical protein